MGEEHAALEARIREAAQAGRWSAAATAAFAGYGEELLGYLVAMTRDQTAAEDAFSHLMEDLWKGLPRFRWECAFRTWAYGLARHALARIKRDPHRRRARPLDDVDVEALVDRLRSRTATFLRSETRDRIARLRAELEPDDQTLLILRINRGLPWRDIARVLADDDGATADADLDKRAAALRKRFERLKTELKARAQAP